VVGQGGNGNGWGRREMNEIFPVTFAMDLPMTSKNKTIAFSVPKTVSFGFWCGLHKPCPKKSNVRKI